MTYMQLLQLADILERESKSIQHYTKEIGASILAGDPTLSLQDTHDLDESIHRFNETYEKIKPYIKGETS